VTNGSTSVNPTTGVVTYTHDGSETVSDSFTYTVQDDQGATSNTATVTITVTPVNDPPVANDDTDTVDEDASVGIAVLANDTDADGTINATTVTIVTDVTNGSTSVNPTTGVVTYTHDGSETVSDSFTYTVNDNNGATSNTATVTITVTPVNDPPVANDDAGAVAGGGSTDIDVVANDTDADGTVDATTVTIVTDVVNGSTSVNPTTGVVTYTHDGSQTTSDSFTYTVQDNNGATSNTATVNITVAPVPTLSTPVLVGGLSTVTSTTATLGATQTGNGGTPVTARGIVWNTTGSPTTSDNTAELETGADLANEAFSGLVGSPPPALTAGTQIFFRGYATNSAGNGYTPMDGTEPANQPTGFGTSAINPTSMTISWSDPGGATAFEGAIIVMKEGADPSVGDEIPADGVEYGANNAWGSAPAIGAGGAKVIFAGAGNSVNVTGLADNTTYYVRIYEYAGNGNGDTGINYLEEAPLTGNETTISGVSQPSNLVFHNIGSTAMTVFWTKGIGDGSIAIMKEGSVVNASPSDGTEHTASSTFTVGENLGSNNHVIYRGNGSSVHVTGLTQGQTYHVAVHTYTGAGCRTH
jgi:hypothetical protein